MHCFIIFSDTQFPSTTESESPPINFKPPKKYLPSLLARIAHLRKLESQVELEIGQHYKHISSTITARYLNYIGSPSPILPRVHIKQPAWTISMPITFYSAIQHCQPSTAKLPYKFVHKIVAYIPNFQNLKIKLSNYYWRQEHICSSLLQPYNGKAQWLNSNNSKKNITQQHSYCIYWEKKNRTPSKHSDWGRNATQHW